MNANSRTRTFLPLVLSTATLLGLWAGSTALAGDDVRSEVVSFHDLNVASPEGAKALFWRIHAAAKRVCAQSDPVLQAGEPRCIRKAEADAVAKLNLPQLVTYYRLQGGEPSQPLIAGR